MAYKEPNDKVKLFKLKQDILGDGIKDSKLKALERLILSVNNIHGINSELAKSVVQNRASSYKMHVQGGELLSLKDSPDNLLLGTFFVDTQNTSSFYLAGETTQSPSETVYPYYGSGYIMLTGEIGSTVLFYPRVYVEGTPAINPVEFQMNSIFAIIKITVKVDLYNEDDVVGPYISDINLEPTIY